MKTTKLKTGVIVTQNEKGSIISVSSPYWVDKPTLLQRIKKLWRS